MSTTTTTRQAVEEGLSWSHSGRIATVTFPSATLNRAFLAWFARVLDRLERDLTAEAVILRGVKSVFMTGADLTEVRELDGESAVRDFLMLPHQLMRRLYRLDKFVVAAINGYCFGGGLELALTCDLRIAAEDLRDSSDAELAFLGMPEARLGLVPALAGTWLLMATVGRRHAMRLLYTGEPVTAARALEIGLVNQLAPRAALAAEAERQAALILGNSGPAFRNMKRLAQSAIDGATFEQALVESASCFAHCCASDEKNLRIDSFRQDLVHRFRAQAPGAGRAMTRDATDSGGRHVE